MGNLDLRILVKIATSKILPIITYAFMMIKLTVCEFYVNVQRNLFFAWACERSWTNDMAITMTPPHLKSPLIRLIFQQLIHGEEHIKPPSDCPGQRAQSTYQHSWYATNDHLISATWINIFVRCHLYIQSGLWCYMSQWPMTVSHYSDVTMGVMASQIISLTVVYSTVYSAADHIKHQSSALLIFVRGIHRSPVISPHRKPVTRKMFPFDGVIMNYALDASAAYANGLYLYQACWVRAIYVFLVFFHLFMHQ